MNKHRLGLCVLSLTVSAVGVSCKKRKFNLSAAKSGATGFAALQPNNCDVIVAGGTTAALAAAIAAAREFADAGEGQKACLLEPTDWAGGQMTSSGVSAIDFPHHRAVNADKSVTDVGIMGRMVTNNSNIFAGWFTQNPPFEGAENEEFGWGGNPGGCWVSVRCYLPKQVLPLIEQTLTDYQANLQVFYNTVVKKVNKNNEGFITSIDAVNRVLPSLGEEYDREGHVHNRRLSTVVREWYKTTNDPKDIYTKTVVNFSRNNGADFPMVLDTTEWGEVLALSGAAYTQGVEVDPSEDPKSANETCGQAIVYPMVIEMKDTDAPAPSDFAATGGFNPERYKDHYHLDDVHPVTKAVIKKYTFDTVWTYRRVQKGPGAVAQIAGSGDISSQNWTSGNDFPYKYLFLSKKDTEAQLGNWQGGIDVNALDEAEQHAIGWYNYLREADPRGKRIVPSKANGTANGLSKVPYIRDTRRSIGIGGFTLKYGGNEGILKGHNFGAETLAIGGYAADVHPTVNKGCSMPPYVVNFDSHPLPFYIPFRALTNSKIPNLLVAGKTMAQSFMTNAASRLHPIEYSTGSAAGVAAAFLARFQPNTFAAWDKGTGPGSAIDSIRIRISEVKDGKNRHTPVEWEGRDRAAAKAGQ